METIKNNADFLFIYEVILANPNGDPDQENKPRMDYDTHTNLVSDVRIKRFVRDYLKNQGKGIFVSMEEGVKVSPETKLENIVNNLNVEDLSTEFLSEDEIKKLKEIKNNSKTNFFKDLQKAKGAEELRRKLLTYLIAKQLIDIRMFGSAFALTGFTNALTGAIQLSWGYSLNKVFLVDSDTIVTIMNEGDSTFGKDYRVYYSIPAFYGTINKWAAKNTHLSDDDVHEFRKALWNGINANPTRSKQGQYPLLYLEIKYKDDYNNNLLGDLRQYIKVKPKQGIKEEEVRKLSDLEFDFSQLIKKIEDNKDKIEGVYYNIDDRLQDYNIIKNLENILEQDKVKSI